MRNRMVFSQPERQARSRLTQLVHEETLLCGSLVTMARTCGRKGCKCCRGEKHVSLYLSTRPNGKRKMIYIPAEAEKKAEAGVRTYQEACRLMRRISNEQLARLLRTARRERKSRRR